MAYIPSVDNIQEPSKRCKMIANGRDMTATRPREALSFGGRLLKKRNIHRSITYESAKLINAIKKRMGIPSPYMRQTNITVKC
jgi:hypothetical protein